MFNTTTPQKGSILLAEPFMLDFNFDRSVILLCEHDIEEGTMGLVLNHRSNLLLSDVISEIESDDYPVYIGGPVNNEALFFIHKIPNQIENSLQLVNDIHFGGDFDQVIFLINNNLITSADIKFFLGYAGWNINQLENEINDNSWAVHSKFPTELLLLQDGEDLWKQAIISLGPKYAHVANFPKSPNMN
ncbi:MAG: YqgE/AlgH family protein [Sphingobacterium sp.]|uniref:YqgE/AlgH family protein n=1 Tax=Sphingobacterium sp. JB170 TaxID=1434842 RepID=UPI00097F25B6|nr:YqgE/AlgH family protein [Sphingobacterium sp. JB170]SJN48472.1 transcriptional regulator, putative [Sphingobacterium sp. JB170]